MIPTENQILMFPEFTDEETQAMKALAEHMGKMADAAEAKPNPLDVQVAGNHYKDKAIQPVEYIAANNLNFLEGCIVKRITRWRDKDGFKDLHKIKHEVDLLIEMETRYGADTRIKG
jgi:hypothetical protein